MTSGAALIVAGFRRQLTDERSVPHVTATE